MNRPPVVSCLTAMLALTACDPLFSTQYRQPIAPLSPDQCVEAALRGSRHVAIVSREENPYGHEVKSSDHIVLRDSATVGGDWDGEAAREQKAPDTPSDIRCKRVGGIFGQSGACSTRA